MDKKYINFYEKFILQTKTLNDCRVIWNSALIDTKLVVDFVLNHQVNNFFKRQPFNKRQIAIHKLISHMKYEKAWDYKKIPHWLINSWLYKLFEFILKF